MGDPRETITYVPASQADLALRYGTLPLRLFLGATFLYAGLQKLFDPGYLSPGGATYIGRQLAAFATNSPIGFLLGGLAGRLAVPTGLTVMVGEMTIGIFALTGLYTRWAALAGAALSFLLFLSASWNVQPYFLGADSIYAVGWVTTAIIGDQGVLSLEKRLRRAALELPADPGRRLLLLRLGAGAVAAIWFLSLLPRARPSPTGGTSDAGQAAGSATPASPAGDQGPTGGTRIGNVRDLSDNGGSITFDAPDNGDPAVVIDLGAGRLVAYDAVCTHEGCTVEYDSDQRTLVCHCHNAVFDPARGARVIDGPAPEPLKSIRVTVGSDGEIYA